MSEISELLQDLMSGRKPIRRHNPKPGQTGWYYMMPKSDDEDTDYDIIDVPNEDTPNPRLQQTMLKQIRTPLGQTSTPVPPQPQPQPQPRMTPPPPPIPLPSVPLQNRVWQKVKDGATIAIDTAKYTPAAFGEFVADAQIASDYKSEMDKTGNILVQSYGKGAGADIDNYYHPLLQCQLAKISPTSRDYGIRLGYLKEIYDYHKKKNYMPKQEIIADSQKDLQNNFYGSNLGYNNPQRSCLEMLDDLRTENMRKKILDSFVNCLYLTTKILLSFIGIFFIALAIWAIFTLSYYDEYRYMKDCQAEGRTKEWCTSVWQELRTID